MNKKTQMITRKTLLGSIIFSICVWINSRKNSMWRKSLGNNYLKHGLRFYCWNKKSMHVWKEKNKGMEEGTQRLKHIVCPLQLSFLSPLIFSWVMTAKRLICFNGVTISIIWILDNKLKSSSQSRILKLALILVSDHQSVCFLKLSQ